MLGSLSPANTVPMFGLLHRVRAPGKIKVGACALSARTFITSEHGSDARLRNNVLILNVPPRFQVGANEFKTVGLLPVECRVEQLKLGHMFNIINLTAPAYLRTNVEMVHHRYPTRASNLACVLLYYQMICCQLTKCRIREYQYHMHVFVN